MQALERLDFETAGRRVLDDIDQRIRDVFYNHRGLNWMHEAKVKPRLELAEGDAIAEIGIGAGTHIGSYAGLNYTGFDVDERLLVYARQKAEIWKINSANIRKTADGKIPLQDESIDKMFAVATMHEVLDLEAELSEIDRVLKHGGIVVIVERLCAIGESPAHIAKLKQIPFFLPEWFGRRGHQTSEEIFRASYCGECQNSNPSFNFYLLAPQKPL